MSRQSASMRRRGVSVAPVAPATPAMTARSGRLRLTAGLVLAALLLAGAGSLAAQTAPKAGGTVKVYGEFEDLFLFQQALKETPEMAGWSDEEVWDGLSAATLQAKTLEREVPDRIVWLGSLEDLRQGKATILAYGDGFGQFWFKLPPGTWTVTGSCEGYQPQERTVTLVAGQTSYLNFYLPRN